MILIPADADGNGYITKDEVLDIVGMFIKFSDPSSQSAPLGDRLKELVVAIFRIFDSNGNGVIEQFELNEILTDIISGITNIVVSLIDYFEPCLLKVRTDCFEIMFLLPSNPACRVFDLNLLSSSWCETKTPNSFILNRTFDLERQKFSLKIRQSFSSALSISNSLFAGASR